LSNQVKNKSAKKTVFVSQRKMNLPYDNFFLVLIEIFYVKQRERRGKLGNMKTLW